MPKLPWRLSALVQTFTQDLLVAEALLFPDVSCVHTDLGRLRKALGKRLRRKIRELQPLEAYRHRLAEPPRVRQLLVEVPPIAGDEQRRNAVTLKLHYVQWRHLTEAYIAYFPALQIEVLAADERELGELLLPQVQSALSRQKTAANLRQLVLLDQHGALEVRPIQTKVKTPTLKEAAIRERHRQKKEKSILKEAASELAKQSLEPVYQREAEVERLKEHLTGPMPRSVLLVGRSGVGKTAIVRELARIQLQQPADSARLKLWSTSGSRIVAGMSGFGMWQDRCERLVRETSKSGAILHLDHLVELIEVGKGGGNTQGVASLLRPAIAAGKLLAIAECTPEALAIVEREDPQLLEAFARLDIDPTTPEQTRKILQRVARAESVPTAITDDALAALDRLHWGYATYSAAPGRPLRFLRNLLHDRATHHTITAKEVTAAFSHETGLPLFMLDDDVPLDLAATRDWFARRVIGQPEPVDLVVDLLAAAKTGLARSGKPIASLLFIGPTGVGKTEMAKSLAEFLYRDRGRMIRFDMSEYAHPAAIERLIGGHGSSQGLLTQKVRDQPFMVVLLDEFEKAHPSFYDVLLQVLGEGRLTDSAGRIADFTSTVVIMTSNLGAESFRHASIGFGDPGSGANAQRHFEREVKAFLRPEMFNRLDRIVPFAPLGPEVIAGIATRELNRALERDGVRLRGVSVAVDEAVATHIAQRGFDLRYGARPLKRSIERELVAPLAEQLTSYHGGVAIDCVVGLEHGRVAIQSQARPITLHTKDSSAAHAIDELLELRRKIQALENSGVLLRIRNELERMEHAERRRRKKERQRHNRETFRFLPEHRKAGAQQLLLARLQKISQEVASVEDMTLLEFHARRPVDAGFVAAAREDLFQQMQELLFDLYRDGRESTESLLVAVYGQSMNLVCKLAAVYEAICRSEGSQLNKFWIKMYREEFDPERREALGLPRLPSAELPVFNLCQKKHSPDEPEERVASLFYALKAAPPEDCIGMALQLYPQLTRSIALLETESGKHYFARDGMRHGTLHVEAVGVGNPLQYHPPVDVGRSGAFFHQRERRTYDTSADICRDALMKRDFALPRDQLQAAIDEAVRTYLLQRVWDLIETWN